MDEAKLISDCIFGKLAFKENKVKQVENKRAELGFTLGMTHLIYLGTQQNNTSLMINEVLLYQHS